MAKKKSGVATKQTKAPKAVEQHPVGSLRREIDGALERFFRDPWGAWSALPGADWHPFIRAGMALNPSADMKETEGAFELNVELPGLDESDIELNVTDDVLTLKGEKSEEKTSGEGESHFSERRYGSFRRAFALPPGVKAGDVKANFSKGVLTIRMPKSEEAKSTTRKIAVDSA